MDTWGLTRDVRDYGLGVTGRLFLSRLRRTLRIEPYVIVGRTAEKKAESETLVTFSCAICGKELVGGLLRHEMRLDRVDCFALMTVEQLEAYRENMRVFAEDDR